MRVFILTRSIFTAVEQELLYSSKRLQRRYRPWLNSYQRTDYLNDYFIGLWMNNWSGLYFCGVKSTGFRSQLGVLLPNICQLILSSVLLAKISGSPIKIIYCSQQSNTYTTSLRRRIHS